MPGETAFRATLRPEHALSNQETLMSSHYHAIVWIDHLEARIFHFNVAEVDRLVLHPHDPTRHIHHKANTIGSGHAAPDHEFLKRVAGSIADAGAVLITGPANAKTELVTYIEQHVPNLRAKIAGVETVDHPSDGELVAHARKYFKADHQAPLRR
jgi:stalled ribosome rescue protein Dom34